SGTFRPEAADGGRAGCRGLDQPADSRDHRISTLNYHFSCLKGVDTFRKRPIMGRSGPKAAHYGTRTPGATYVAQGASDPLGDAHARRDGLPDAPARYSIRARKYWGGQ